ncbi:uncharacterized protein LOC143249648 [Tachypleus tridentatus]|uniref:uncharacterized protein LOC143249648 n=1 Tax=Tachypleus tridentatus TaxID=6853 RepID=UPI003FD36999
MDILLTLLPVLTSLSLKMQDNSTTVDIVSDKLAVYKEKLGNLNHVERSHKIVKELTTCEQTGKWLLRGKVIAISGQTRARGPKSATKETVAQSVAEETAIFIGKIVTYLNERFDEFDNDFIDAFQIFEQSNCPKSKEALSSYGHNGLQILLNHFGALIEAKGFNITADICQADLHETLLKATRLAKSDESLASRASGLWAHMLSQITVEDGKSFPGSTVLALVCLMQVISVSSAEPERGFSQMAVIKDDWRSKLINDSLNVLMTI